MSQRIGGGEDGMDVINREKGEVRSRDVAASLPMIKLQG